MDPRSLPLKRTRHFSKGRIVGLAFSVGPADTLRIHGPAAMDVTLQGHYIFARGEGFEVDGLENYDEESGILHQSERATVTGLVTLGMIAPNESDEDAIERLVAGRVPDVQALWDGMKDRERAMGERMVSALRGGASRNLKELGIDTNDVEFDDGRKPFR